MLERALDTEASLSEDQRRAIRKLCTSGHQIQGLMGPAGTGKTFVLRVAAQAWRDAGYQIVGAAVQGTAAENLQRLTGIPSHTVAALLARADRATPSAPLIGPQSVVVLDEAGTIGTFDLARLTRLTADANAKLVLAGDPAQHRSVPAGGGFAAILDHHRPVHAELRTDHRQSKPELAPVRAALTAMRERSTDAAIHHLAVDERLEAKADLNQAYDAVVHDWYQDRLHLHRQSPHATTCMISERHTDRLELIRRARSLLQASGELHGPTLSTGNHAFQAGDEVICTAPAHDLFPPGQPDRYLRNGTTGRVVRIEDPRTPRSAIVIDFDDRGQIHIPAARLERQANEPSAGLLTHSYALTSHAAQGATFEAAQVLTTEHTSATALYVAASRARSDLHIYATTRKTPSPQQPRDARSPTSPIQELARSLRRPEYKGLAIDLNPTVDPSP
jgi:ATP-dependent exoDNAse (exonuclease V) alpha subunit